MPRLRKLHTRARMADADKSAAEPNGDVRMLATGSSGAFGRPKLRRFLWLLVFSTLTVGLLLIFARNNFTHNQAYRDQILTFGASLVTFGFTTVLATIFVNSQLESELLNRVGGEMATHVARVDSSMQGSLKEVRSIMTSSLSNIESAMQDTTATFKKSVDDFNPLVGNCTRLGMVNVYLTRSDALSDFAVHLEEELKEAASNRISTNNAQSPPAQEEKEQGRTAAQATRVEEKAPMARLWIVASSMKGVRETAAGRFDGAGLLIWASQLAEWKLLDMRILMTHPEYANVRASQEMRLRDAIPDEIKETVDFLKSCSVPTNRIRLVCATPTVFAVATRVEMLLNPYPYSAEAFRSFTLRVKKVHLAPSDRHVAIHRDIFEQYEHRHFQIPWEKGIPLESDYGIPSAPSHMAPWSEAV
jgi:hypothetical protein